MPHYTQITHFPKYAQILMKALQGARPACDHPFGYGQSDRSLCWFIVLSVLGLAGNLMGGFARGAGSYQPAVPELAAI